MCSSDLLGANVDQYAPNHDATRFLLRRPRGTTGGVDLHVIVNWPTLLKTAGESARRGSETDRK